jgi:hypothetical protein
VSQLAEEVRPLAASRLTGGLIALGFALFMFGLAPPARALPRRCQAAVAEVKTRIRIDLHTGTWAFVEADGGRDLTLDADAVAPTCGRHVVGMLVSELQDPDDLVRLYAAQALGTIGPQARSAVPH